MYAPPHRPTRAVGRDTQVVELDRHSPSDLAEEVAKLVDGLDGLIALGKKIEGGVEGGKVSGCRPTKGKNRKEEDRNQINGERQRERERGKKGREEEDGRGGIEESVHWDTRETEGGHLWRKNHRLCGETATRGCAAWESHKGKARRRKRVHREWL